MIIKFNPPIEFMGTKWFTLTGLLSWVKHCEYKFRNQEEYINQVIDTRFKEKINSLNNYLTKTKNSEDK
jgi:hypothetical protein